MAVGAGNTVGVGVGSLDSAVAAAAANFASLVATMLGSVSPLLHANASTAVKGSATFRSVFNFLMAPLLRPDGMPLGFDEQVNQSRIRESDCVHQM